MATLVLQVVGSALGQFLGGPIGAAIGSAVGATAGNYIDRSLLSGGAKNYEGPRLKSLQGITASEGAPIARLYGRARLGGQVIWATQFEEVTARSKVQGGGKGSPSTPSQTTYSYFANVAIGLCEGEIAFVRRVWADGKLLDLGKVTMRVYRGGESQQPDPLIIAKEGRGDVPAYRGLAYVVFERMPLEDYGNRLPVLSFEVVRPVDGMAQMVRAIDLIPGSTEFGYETVLVTQLAEFGVSRAENRNQLTHPTDFSASLDALQALCPNLKSVALVVAWFGDDLRAGNCTIRPKIDLAGKTTTGAEWAVSGLLRATATEVSMVNGKAAFGGTPSDNAVIHAITELKARGLAVMLYPFIMMDVPIGNTLPNPWAANNGQPAYPWRGRITCFPARGLSGSVDGTAAADAQVHAFFGTAQAAHFPVPLAVNALSIDYFGEIGDGVPVVQSSVTSIAYTGPAEWSFRRFVLHQAALARAAGGVSAFLLASECVGLTRVRGAASFPAVGEFISLASQARMMLGSGTKISYAADWTEYGSYAPSGMNDLYFPLDPLWSNANFDFVGIDFYAPLTDWRDGRDHADAALANSIYDVDYLTSRFQAGESYDWYYANDANRAAQIRTPISDGAYGKPWVFRAKDIGSWWSNAHVERIAGVERTSPTGWTPKSKPIWLTEFGVPAVDKGSNAPNVFPDPKSSESAYPPFSHQNRDDLIQARTIEALYRNFDPSHPSFKPETNPVSPLYGGRMVDPDRLFLWTWDARPFPAFPHSQDVWADGSNWISGHWLTGRLEGMPLDRLIAKMMADFGLGAALFDDVDGFVDGYVVDRPMAARAALQPITSLYGVEAIASAGVLRFAGRRSYAAATLGNEDFVPDRQGALLRQTRTQDSELPHEVSVNFVESSVDFRPVTASSRRLTGASKRETRIEIAALMPRTEGQRLVDAALQDAWVGRDVIEFSMRPSWLSLEIGDVVTIVTSGTAKLFRIATITDGPVRKVSARAVEPSIYDAAAGSSALASIAPVAAPGPPFALVLDLPAANGTPPALQFLAVSANPWPGSVTIWRRSESGGYSPYAAAVQPAIVGRTLSDLPPGPIWRWDRNSRLTVLLQGGAISSVDEASLLDGANTVCIRGSDGQWEILSFARADLTGPKTYSLSNMLRGQKGSEPQAARIVPAGAPFVVLDSAIVPLVSGVDTLGQTSSYKIVASDRDYSDPGTVSVSAQVRNLALLPLSPVRAAARRSAGSITLSWIRRTRTGGDNWAVVEVPLGETLESYQLEILSGTIVRRSVTVALPAYVYTSADELADFGSQQSTLRLRVRQISGEVGPGAAYDGLVSVI